MLTSQLTHVIIFLAAILLIGYAHPMIQQRQEVRPLCMGCGDNCNKCDYGSTKSTYCNITECRRGPGQVCGGPSDIWGICGDGLICACSRCVGCSLESLECFEHLCLPHENVQSRNLNIYDRSPFERM